MVTAPTSIRPPSVTTSNRRTEKRPYQMTDSRVSPIQDNFIEEELDNSVNPWQHLSVHSNIEHPPQTSRRTPQLRLPSPMYHRQQQQRLGSPPLYPQLVNRPNSSASSSVTATPQYNLLREQSVYTPSDSRSASRSQYTSIALGPATKRALESLQQEIIALNDRIDDLRKELVERDKQRAVKKKSDDEEEEESDMDDGWKWVIKVTNLFVKDSRSNTNILIFIGSS